jgi:hypothetical protein
LAQTHSGDCIIFKRCKYALVFSCAVTMAVKLGDRLIFFFSLSLTFGNYSLVTRPLLELPHCCCHLAMDFWFSRRTIWPIPYGHTGHSPHTPITQNIAWVAYQALTTPCGWQPYAKTCQSRKIWKVLINNPLLPWAFVGLLQMVIKILFSPTVSRKWAYPHYKTCFSITHWS